MPVIRVDEQVWRELQKRAEPLVDTPNSVLRRVLDLEQAKASNENVIEIQAKEKVIEIQLGNLHTPRTWALIPVPKEKRRFFPGYKVWFELQTDVGTVRTRMTSAPKGTPIGDPDGGAYIQGNLRPWFDSHPRLQPSDKLRFEVLEPGRRYKLSVIPGGGIV